ncbi:MAG: hypothetical protein M3296_05250, partial [Actinomycetota bacterium]|nr:hypothetical protein [Actinomycetota bacterium]
MGIRDATRRWAGRLLAGILALLLGAVAAPEARARVVVVATARPQVALIDVSTDRVSARLALPGSARAVAVSPDGQRGYVAAGATIVAFDVNARAESARGGFLGPEISDLELSPRGETLYAVQGPRLLVVDAQTLAVRRTIDLRGAGSRLAVGGGGR